MFLPGLQLWRTAVALLVWPELEQVEATHQITANPQNAIRPAPIVKQKPTAAL